MAIFIVQAVERSPDGGNSVRVVNRWPYEADNREEAMAFVDRTPSYAGWGAAHLFEILDAGSTLLASRAFAGGEWTVPEAE